MRLAALFILPAVLLTVGEAAAQRRIEMNCPQMVATVPPAAVWWGRFSGGKEFQGRGTVINKTTEACFRTRQDCERWLYDLKSEYQYAPRWNQCRLGYAPGAPTPRL